MRKIYSSVDIGSSFIKIVVLEELDKKFNILSSNYYPSDGIKKGIIIDDAKVEKVLRNAFDEINKALGIKINSLRQICNFMQKRYLLCKTQVLYILTPK